MFIYSFSDSLDEMEPTKRPISIQDYLSSLDSEDAEDAGSDW